MKLPRRKSKRAGALRLLLLVLGALRVSGQSAATFTIRGSMTIPRSQHSATLLQDGRVLIAGGAIGCNDCRPMASAEIYDPGTGAFRPTGNMTSARSKHAAILLPDGKVLIAGGGPPDSAEIYDPSTETFTATANLPPNSGSPAALLNDGRVLFVSYAGAGLYDPSNGTFSPTSPRAIDGERTAVLQPDGNVLLLPVGSTEAFAIERYDSRSNTFTESGWPFMAAFFDLDADIGYTTASANLLGSGAVLLTLYGVGVPANNYGLRLQLSTGTFSQTSQQMLFVRQGARGTSLADGTVLITGGYGEQCTAPPHAELYNTASDIFSDAGPMVAYRESYTATLLKDGRVLVVGGMGCPAVGGKYTQLASAEIYRPTNSVPPPTLLSLSGNGTGQAAVQHADTYQLVSADSPAVAGEVMVIYCTGLNSGSVIPPQVAIGGRLADVLFFGDTLGYPGLNQINVRVPSGIVAGPIVPIRLNYLGRPSNEVSIAVQ
jgi:hypothetical protein